MTWNWQHRNWPNFEWDRTEFKKLDQQFYLLVGEAIGSIKYLSQEDLSQLRVELLLNEVMNTSEIEGELLDRDSVQSSLRKAFGLLANRSLVSPAEAGVVEMMLDVYANFQQTLSHQSLWDWHAMLMNGRRDLLSIGAYRTHDDSMQIISGPIGRRRVHFEAPPSARVSEEMDQFINWYNSALTDSELTPLERASLSHLYFESIHPFEDGNGRIGRALVEKSLSQSIGDSVLVQAQSIGESAEYTWFNNANEIIHVGQSFMASPQETTTYTLQVQADVDLYKDYDKVTVNVIPYKLNSLSPNPATNLCTVGYLAEGTSNAALLIVNSSSGASFINTSLDPLNTSADIVTSSLTTGSYLVILTCDSQIADSANLQIQ